MQSHLSIMPKCSDSMRFVLNLREFRCSRFYLDRTIIISATWVLAMSLDSYVAVLIYMYGCRWKAIDTYIVCRSI